MINLLQETIEALNSICKDESDVLWVGATRDDRWMTWEEFKEIANFEYIQIGRESIRSDLVVVGHDWWLERYKEDYSEGWHLKTFPEKPPIHEQFDPKEDEDWG